MSNKKVKLNKKVKNIKDFSWKVIIANNNGNINVLMQTLRKISNGDSNSNLTSVFETVYLYK